MSTCNRLALEHVHNTHAHTHGLPRLECMVGGTVQSDLCTPVSAAAVHHAMQPAKW